MRGNERGEVTMSAKGRLASLDAVRGFDMFFIMGGEELVCAVAALFGCADFGTRFGHVPWHGLQFMDTVFPMFLFLAGVSFPFSVAKSRERGLGPRAIALKALRRGLTLFVLGLAYGGFLRTFDFANFRIWSVLGRIGLAWMVAAWLYLLAGARMRAVVAGALLVATTLLTVFTLAPDAASVAERLGDAASATDPFSVAGNLGCWLDRALTGGHCYTESFDPEGFAGIPCAIVTAMLGMFAGEIVRSPRWDAGRKTLLLTGFGGALALAGCALSWVFPINKALWSPSFALVVGGYSAILFAAFHWIIDVRGWTKWAFFFKVIGMNSITIYLLQTVFDIHSGSNFLFGGLARIVPGAAGEIVASLGYIAVCWLILLFLYRKQTFLKV